MAAEYTLIGAPRTRAIRVAWALEELGLDYEWIPARPRSEAALARNPSGKVPSLGVQGATLTDSVAIVQFLADRRGAMTHPAGTVARGVQDGFTQFAVEEVDGALWMAARHRYVLQEAERLSGAAALARADFDRAMATLAARLGDRDFVAGDVFTTPDLILGHCATWAERAGFDLPEGALGAYFERIRSRPALARAHQRAAA